MSNPVTESHDVDAKTGLLTVEFWREHSHLFIPAHWGPAYCRCCMDSKVRKIHKVETDSATHPGNCTSYPVARSEEIQFGVSAWNDDGAACHYGSRDSYAEALKFVDGLKEHGDRSRDNRRWEHFQIEERRYFTACDTNVVVLA